MGIFDKLKEKKKEKEMDKICAELEELKEMIEYGRVNKKIVSKFDKELVEMIDKIPDLVEVEFEEDGATFVSLCKDCGLEQSLARCAVYLDKEKNNNAQIENRIQNQDSDYYDNANYFQEKRFHKDELIMRNGRIQEPLTKDFVQENIFKSGKEPIEEEIDYAKVDFRTLKPNKNKKSSSGDNELVLEQENIQIDYSKVDFRTLKTINQQNLEQTAKRQKEAIKIEEENNVKENEDVNKKEMENSFDLSM